MIDIRHTNQLGEVIRAERKRQSLTPEQVAAIGWVSVRFVHELEHGKAT